MENKIRAVLLDKRIANLVGKDNHNNPKIYLLSAPEGTLAPYIEYQIVTDEGVLYSEGNEDITNYEIQIDIYTKGSYVEIRNAVKEVLSEEEYERSYGGSMYEKETKLYHYVMRYEKGDI